MNRQIIFLVNKLKNASLSRKKSITVLPTISNIKIAELLYEAGYIQSYSVFKNDLDQFNVLRIFLRVQNGKVLLNNLKLLSTLSREKVLKYKDVTFLNQQKNTFILSTAFGLLNARNCIKHRLGGILLFQC